ncbi:hypothetical protein [Prescottella equi]|uniref:hypothetical protein n=1 Tax=Rhodococcus hoagii TaxID=43767 RepID=UPI00111BF90D|nr:hypothetical protein [Prescottella equi]
MTTVRNAAATTRRLALLSAGITVATIATAGVASAGEPIIPPTVTATVSGMTVTATVTNNNPASSSNPLLECFPEVADIEDNNGNQPWWWPKLPQASAPGFGVPPGQTKTYTITVPYIRDYRLFGSCWVRGDIGSAVQDEGVRITVDGTVVPEPEPEPEPGTGSINFGS